MICVAIPVTGAGLFPGIGFLKMFLKVRAGEQFTPDIHCPAIIEVTYPDSVGSDCWSYNVGVVPGKSFSCLSGNRHA